jgi:hypothetical protein
MLIFFQAIISIDPKHISKPPRPITNLHGESATDVLTLVESKLPT